MASTDTAIITLHPRQPPSQPSAQNQNQSQSPLPPLLQTPAGLALLELQGTIKFSDLATQTHEGQASGTEIPIGRLTFPEYRPDNGLGIESKAWMKRAYLYVGEHQRLAGEVKSLGKPMAVVRRRDITSGGYRGDGDGEDGEGTAEELEVVEIVKYKIVFSQRPEPVSRS